MLLILTSDKDLTADFLIIALIERRLPYYRLNAEDLAKANYVFTIDRDGVNKEISIGRKTLKLSQVHSVWYRRAVHPNPESTLSPGERIFVAGELRHLATGLILNPDVTWVNPIDRVSNAEHKLYQLQIARKLGFRVPRTIISRDTDTLRSFAAANSAGTICKPIYHGMFFEGSTRYSVYTRRVLPGSLKDESVKICPVLLQEEIPRIADVRATFIGSQSFIAEIRSDRSLVDWRDPEASIRCSVSSLTDEVERRCRAMLAELGLLYGAFDFVRTPDNELIFLEVNPTGEWAWLENQLGFRMRDAFIELFFGDQK